MNMQNALQTAQLFSTGMDVAIKTSTLVAVLGATTSVVNVAVGTGCYAIGGIVYLVKAVVGTEKEINYTSVPVEVLENEEFVYVLKSDK
jgi:hypothetical protein